MTRECCPTGCDASEAVVRQISDMQAKFSSSDIIQIALQGFPDHRKGDLTPGDLCPLEQLHLKAFRPYSKFVCKQLSDECQIDLADVRKTKYGVELCNCNLGMSFFEGLPPRGLLRPFSELHEPRGICPEP